MCHSSLARRDGGGDLDVCEHADVPGGIGCLPGTRARAADSVNGAWYDVGTGRRFAEERWDGAPTCLRCFEEAYR